MILAIKKMMIKNVDEIVKTINKNNITDKNIKKELVNMDIS